MTYTAQTNEPEIVIKEEDGYLYAEQILNNGLVHRSTRIYHTERAIWKDYCSPDFWDDLK